MDGAFSEFQRKKIYKMLLNFQQASCIKECFE